MATWQLQEAKAKLSQLIHDSEKKPQFISKHGVEVRGCLVKKCHGEK